MKRFALFILILAILGAGGTLTALMGGGVSPSSIPGAKVQCAETACSVFTPEPWQAGQFVLLVGFILFNLVGIGATLALVFWFLSKQIATVKSISTGSSGDGAAKSA